MSYSEGLEYISPLLLLLLLSADDLDDFFDVVVSSKPFPADSGRLLLDIEHCLEGKLDRDVKKASVGAVESAVKMVTKMA